MKAPAKWLMILGYAICLLQIWLPAYFLTGDGPCHVYNARVIHDLLADDSATFYSRFYTLSFAADPNWLSHTLLALLMFVVNGVVAEKILLSAYVILFITGFTTLLKRLGNGNTYVPLLAFVFVFNGILLKGFYNFSFGIAVLFWIMEVWQRYLDNRKAGMVVLFCFLSLFLFFTHPLGFVFGWFGCFALTVSVALSAPSVSLLEKIKSALLLLLKMTLCFVPGILLFFNFINKDGRSGRIDLYIERYRVDDLLQNTYLPCYTNAEVLPAQVLAYLFIALFIGAVFYRLIKKRAILKYDGVLLVCAIAGFLYLYCPDKMLGGDAFSVRAHYILFLFAACSIAWLVASNTVKAAIGLLCFAFFIVLTAIRVPCQWAASRATADYISATQYIKPQSVVLPLVFDRNGKDEKGNVIADKSWLFVHAADYLGAKKPLILLDNYEANVGYFPIKWKAEVNPYIFLNKYEGTEGMPPYAPIGAYKSKTGVDINYIILWCYTPVWLEQEHFRMFYAEITAGYHITYTSPGGRTILFEKNR